MCIILGHSAETKLQLQLSHTQNKCKLLHCIRLQLGSISISNVYNMFFPHFCFEQAVYQDGESVGEPRVKIAWSKVHKNFRARPVVVEKDYSYMEAMVADVISSSPVTDADQGMSVPQTHVMSVPQTHVMSVPQTHVMAPQERPARSQIISDTMQFSRFNQ